MDGVIEPLRTKAGGPEDAGSSAGEGAIGFVMTHSGSRVGLGW